MELREDEIELEVTIRNYKRTYPRPRGLCSTFIICLKNSWLKINPLGCLILYMKWN